MGRRELRSTVTRTRKSPFTAIRRILRDQSFGGFLLIGAAVVAMMLANSGAAERYFGVFATSLGGHDVRTWINDGPMALFFLLVGLEIKRELLDGELSTPARRRLPIVAALAGMAVPAMIFVAINRNDPAALAGWAIPAATDIAFALGILTLLGSRVPASLKLFVTAVAIIDDLGAIVIIAVAYTDTIHLTALAAAAVLLALLTVFNRLRIDALWPYLAVGGALWFAVLQSGVHATLAGVAVAATIPLRVTRGRPEDATSPLIRLEHRLSPLIAFGVVPLFAFANAGIDLRAVSPAALVAPLPLGIAVALVLGKQVGVLGAVWGMVRAGLADCPADASWQQLWGAALLCGIGFTMSLFIANLAFTDAAQIDAAKLGIVAGSLIAALGGAAILAWRR